MDREQNRTGPGAAQRAHAHTHLAVRVEVGAPQQPLELLAAVSVPVRERELPYHLCTAERGTGEHQSESHRLTKLPASVGDGVPAQTSAARAPRAGSRHAGGRPARRARSPPRRAPPSRDRIAASGAHRAGRCRARPANRERERGTVHAGRIREHTAVQSAVFERASARLRGVRAGLIARTGLHSLRYS